MPQVELQSRYQKCVLWAKAGVDPLGRYTVLAPVELTVRWEEKRRQATDPKGNTIGIDATVILDQEIAVGSVMRLGRLADLPAVPDNLKQVAMFNDITDIKGRSAFRTVGLIRYDESLPAIVSP